MGERVLAAHLDHIPDYPHGVGINGKDMEQVVLHLADNIAKLRQISPQYIVLLHGRQGLVKRMRGSE